MAFLHNTSVSSQVFALVCKRKVRQRQGDARSFERERSDEIHLSFLCIDHSLVNNWPLEHTNASRSSISDGRITGTNVVSPRVKVSELDPEEYRVFRKLLKKALWEYHRSVSCLLNASSNACLYQAPGTDTRLSSS